MMRPYYQRTLFLTCPTGAYCREDRCQSFFDSKLIPTMRPPLEECEAAGAIREAGGQSLVIDAPALGVTDEAVLARIAAYAPDLIVLAVTFGSLDQDLLWARVLKERYPDVPIGLRGGPCYSQGEELLERHGAIDFCLRGDYEIIFESIMRHGLEMAAGVVWRSRTGEITSRAAATAPDLDILPLPDRRCIDSLLYRVRFFGMRQATIRVQRGCPFPCTYCLVRTVNGSVARHRSVESIIREVRSVMEDGIRCFYFRADTFSVDRKWALALAEGLLEECPGIRWISTTRVECVDDGLLDAFARSGCYGLSFGIDVASEEIARQVRKPLSLPRAYEAMRLCDRHGILSLGYVMVGFLWDTPQTLEESARFIQAVRPDLLTVHYAHPYPGTPYYDAVMAASQKVISTKSQAEPALDPEHLPASAVHRFGLQLLRNHYRQPSVLWSIAKKLGTLGIGVMKDRVLSGTPFPLTTQQSA